MLAKPARAFRGLSVRDEQQRTGALAVRRTNAVLRSQLESRCILSLCVYVYYTLMLLHLHHSGLKSCCVQLCVQVVWQCSLELQRSVEQCICQRLSSTAERAYLLLRVEACGLKASVSSSSVCQWRLGGAQTECGNVRRQLRDAYCTENFQFH